MESSEITHAMLLKHKTAMVTHMLETASTMTTATWRAVKPHSTKKRRLTTFALSPDKRTMLAKSRDGREASRSPEGRVSATSAATTSKDDTDALDRLAEQIAELAAHIHAATYRLAKAGRTGPT